MTQLNPSPDFRVPMDGETYISNVRERSFSLISSGIWAGMTQPQLRAWLNNFTGERESYFAACILDALIYRSSQQTVALMDHMLQRALPNLAQACGIMQEQALGWREPLSKGRRRDDPGIRLVPVIRPDDPPTKSGPVIARMYKRDIGLSERWFIWPNQIEDAVAAGIDSFLFVDDFLGTGTQFLRFIHQHNLDVLLKDRTAIYAPLVAHQQGLTALAKSVPWLRVCCVERLSNSYCLLSSGSQTFNDGANVPATARAFYFDMLRNREMRFSRTYAAGFGRLSLAYVFEHATPNNCLPLLWSSSRGWQPLFQR